MTLTVTLAGVLWTLYAISVLLAMYVHVALSSLGDYPWWGKIGGLLACLIWPVALVLLVVISEVYTWLTD